jgi:UDP:flavonoid glycosyltransferase YjiC (YdhE family)
MKILVPALGSRGDVQPYIALAAALKRHGHDVTLATHPMMRPLVESYGIPFAPMGPDVDLGKEAAIIRGKSRNWVLGFARTMKFTQTILEQSVPDILALARGIDLMVVGHASAGSMEADLLGLPEVSVTLMPQAIPTPDPTRPLYKKLGLSLAGAFMSLLMVRPFNQLRKRQGLPPMGPEGITSTRLNMIPVSPAVYAPDPRWEPRHRVTGYWFCDEPEDWHPPPELEAFIEAGDPPVVITLGAMSAGGNDAREMAALTVTAVEQAGVRAVVQGWDTASDVLRASPSIFPAGSMPHSWLLAHAGGMVHHGGFGSTAAGLRAGIPSMAIPHILDQFIWGGRIAELGAGPKPIPRTKISAPLLADALSQIAHNPGLRNCAAEIGYQIRSEQGTEKAVELIEAAV